MGEKIKAPDEVWREKIKAEQPRISFSLPGWAKKNIRKKT